jgi:hypothetical protein
MKYLNKYNEFITESSLNEVGLPILIDENGRIHFSEDDEYEMGILHMKEFFIPFNTKINVVAGIDHNGIFHKGKKNELTLPIHKDDIQRAHDSMGVKLLNYGTIWGDLSDSEVKTYKELLRKDLSTNINQKVDLEATKKITYRYSRTLSEIIKSVDGADNFRTMFDKIFDLISINDNNDMYKELRKITQDMDMKKKVQLSNCVYNLINQLASIRYYTNPSSAGFFFEEYVSALTDGIAIGGFGAEDVENIDGKIQCKFYQPSSSVPLGRYKDLNYLILAIKYVHVVHVYEIDIQKIKNKSQIKNYFDGYGSISAQKLINDLNLSEKDAKIIDFRHMNSILSSIETNKSEIVDRIISIQKKVYRNVKNIQNDIDSVFMGIDQKNKKIDIVELGKTIKDDIKKKSDEIIDNIEDFLNID